MRLGAFPLSVAVLWVCSASSAAGAPTTQPAAHARPAAPRKWFQFDDLSFDLGFDSRFERRQVIFERPRRFDFRDRQLNEEFGFEETLGMRTSGAVLDERFFRFDLGARWGFSQEGFFERRPGRDLRERPDADVLEYDFSIDLFPEGKISANVFGSQLDDRIPRPFLPSLDRRRERFGASLFFNDRKLPMQLSFEHLFDDISGGRDRFDDEQFATDTLRYEGTWHISEYHSLRWEYEYDDRDEQYAGLGDLFDTRRNYFTLDHALRFGPDHQHSLDTLFRVQDESGDLARDTVEVAPRLRIEHSDSLTTTYGAQYLRETFQGVRIQQYRSDVGLIHRFGESLTTSIDLYGLRQDNDDRSSGRGGGVDVSDWGGVANVAFSRENKLGRLSANLAYTHNRVRQSDDRNGGVVISESVNLRDPQSALLVHSDIRRHTIIVTDAQRTRIYRRGLDYLVISAGRYTAMRRVRSGRITDGQTVLVSYTYRTFAGFELTRDRIDLRLQQDFEFGLTPYYAASIQNEDLARSRFQTFGQRNVNRHRIGLTYRLRRWSAGAEYEYNDETIDPFQAFHLNCDLVLFETVRQQLSGNGRLSRFWFDGAGRLRKRTTTLLDLGLAHRFVLAPDLETNTAATYRFEDDSLFGQTQGVDVTGSLAYTIGLFSLLFEVEYDLLDLPDSSDNTFAVWIKLRRDIPVFGQRRRPQSTRWN